MLFICSVCKYGYISTQVECFVDPCTRKQSYFCNEHLDSSKTTGLVHIPWLINSIDNIDQFYVSRESELLRQDKYIAAAKCNRNENK
mgnify:FL=1|tara:strand:- start:4868 stop:5128 length:261 start_codon:yes stop_codon:yes gene_type:complete